MKLGVSNTIPNIVNLPGQGGGGSVFSSTKALEFDGTDNYVDTGITNTGTNDISVSCWIKTTEVFSYTVSRCAFGGRSNVGGANYTLGRLGSGFATPDDMQVRVYNTLGTTKLNDGDWHNIVYTYNFTTKEVKAYVDGNTTAEATVTFGAWNTNYRIAIGWNGYDAQYYFEGNVDECAYFTRVLGASDITEIYNSGIPADISGMSDLEKWWRMGENSTFKETQILMPEQSNKDKVSNYSMAFDGIGGYVDTGAKLSVDGLATASFSLWFLTDSTGYKYIFGDGNANRLLYHQPSGRIDLTFDGSVDYRTYSAPTVFGDWNNIVITFDGSLAQADRLKVYLNGGTPIANTLGGTTSTVVASVVNFYIGRAGTYSANKWVGNLDEFSIWNTALSQSEVTEIYNSGTPNDLATHSGAAALVNWWRMGEEAIFDPAAPEWTIPDQVGSNDGISANMDIYDRTGDAPDSSNNALSYNMDAADIVPR